MNAPPGLLTRTPWWLRAHSTACLLFLYLPVAVLVVFSFSDSASSMVWGGFTSDWYAKLARTCSWPHPSARCYSRGLKGESNIPILRNQQRLIYLASASFSASTSLSSV